MWQPFFLIQKLRECSLKLAKGGVMTFLIFKKGRSLCFKVRKRGGSLVFRLPFLPNLKVEKCWKKNLKTKICIKHVRIFIQTNALFHIFSFSISLQFNVLSRNLAFWNIQYTFFKWTWQEIISPIENCFSYPYHVTECQLGTITSVTTICHYAVSFGFNQQ